ncbi:unnamed protein product [Didymodactylos carnosus]|uniref:RBR-type E3 ubiquitin transferase n=1 Tax=Didymodactylos carnosus TaxID=1234261 RepID=A0A8S2DCG7_9BILA|nr:unnamed protein product [Didymodactylos carnosus]CAF3646031.1 unnamed protein product [Didymodactylos carnosus]
MAIKNSSPHQHRWQHCSLFNLDVFDDDRKSSSAITNTVNTNCSSVSNVDISYLKKKIIPLPIATTPPPSLTAASLRSIDIQSLNNACQHTDPINHSCSISLNNYNTKLEHVVETLITNTDHSLDNNDAISKTHSINRKLMLGSTAILDNFLKNNLKTNNNAGNSVVVENSTTQRRWHSERGARHPNLRANLPLTTAQRQVLERYLNYPLQKPTHIRTRQQPTGMAAACTGTALQTVTNASGYCGQTNTSVSNRPLSYSSHTSMHRPLSSTSSAESQKTSTNNAAFVQRNRNSFITGSRARMLREIQKKKNQLHQQENNPLKRRKLSDIDGLATKLYGEETDTDDENIDDEIEQSESDNEEDPLEESDEREDEIQTEFPTNGTISLVNQKRIKTITQSLTYPIGRELQSECSICYENKLLQLRTCCEFHVCNYCMNEYIEHQIRQRTVKIQCPNMLCQQYIHRDEIITRLRPEIREKFFHFLADVNREINVKTCPRCSNVHEIDRNLFLHIRKAPTKVQCAECNLIWCFQCHAPWHDGITCKEFRRGDRMLKTWAKEVHYGQHNAVSCPRCKVYIQRTKGCDHMSDHYSEFSVLGCKYRFYPDKPFKRRLIRGSILGGKIIAAPLIVCFAIAAACVFASVAVVALPVYGGFLLVRQLKLKRRACHRQKTFKDPVLISYKAFNEMFPQLIPREPTIGAQTTNTTACNLTNPIRITDTAEVVSIDEQRDKKTTTVAEINIAPIAHIEECEIEVPLNCGTTNALTSKVKQPSIFGFKSYSVCNLQSEVSYNEYLHPSSSSSFSPCSLNFPRLTRNSIVRNSSKPQLPTN